MIESDTSILVVLQMADRWTAVTAEMEPELVEGLTKLADSAASDAIANGTPITVPWIMGAVFTFTAVEIAEREDPFALAATTQRLAIEGAVPFNVAVGPLQVTKLVLWCIARRFIDGDLTRA